MSTSLAVKLRPLGQGSRTFTTSSWLQEKKIYKMVVVGGGSGGCSMAAKFASKLGRGKLAVIEPSKNPVVMRYVHVSAVVFQKKNRTIACGTLTEPFRNVHIDSTHYYQPMWTLVGGGLKSLPQSQRPMSSVLPTEADWIQDRVVTFHPEKSMLVTEKGLEVCYEYLIVGMGFQLHFEKVKGLPDALDTPGVCSNYSPTTVEKTFKCIQTFSKGNAIFTFPTPPIKCPGAPQKIMYLADDYFRKNGTRKDANIIFNTALDFIFAAKKYADELLKIIEARDICLNFKHNLIEVNSDKRETVFQKVGTNEKVTFKYDLLHVTPPMSPPDALMKSPLADQAGFLDINAKTLQHVKYPNVFGIGDCTNLPTQRTAAAVAAECGVLHRNLTRFMEGKSLEAEYNGYTSCPLVTKYGKCIMAEFDYNGKPLETFPVDQGKERTTMYYLNKDFLPQLYWTRMLKGKWDGPAFVQKLTHLGMASRNK